MHSRILVAALLTLAVGATPAAAADPKIVGGTVAAEGAYPAQVRLSITTFEGTFLCGGTLVAKTKVVTAAHCVDGADAAGVTAFLGSNSISAGTPVAASSFVIHPSYDAVSAANDVAVISLATPVTQQPIALLDPAADPFATGDLARVVGWGTTSDGGAVSPSLLEVDVPLVDDTVCGAPASYGSELIAAVMICAGLPAGGKDSCQGDSGGPLMLKAAGLFKLLGVVSWGDGCALPNKYGVYTELPNAALRSFVLEQAGAPPALSIAPVTSAFPGTAVALSATASDPSPGGGVGDITWDLDEDGEFDDAVGSPTSWTPPSLGVKRLRAKVSDLDGMLTSSSARSPSRRHRPRRRRHRRHRRHRRRRRRRSRGPPSRP